MNLRRELKTLAQHHREKADKLLLELEGLTLWTGSKAKENPSMEAGLAFINKHRDLMLELHTKWAELLQNLTNDGYTKSSIKADCSEVLDANNIFCNCDGEHNDTNWYCTDADMIIGALNDARETMDYSNWHTGKFDVAIEVIKRFCKDNKIPMRFVK